MILINYNRLNILNRVNIKYIIKLNINGNIIVINRNNNHIIKKFWHRNRYEFNLYDKITKKTWSYSEEELAHYILGHDMNNNIDDFRKRVHRTNQDIRVGLRYEIKKDKLLPIIKHNKDILSNYKLPPFINITEVKEKMYICKKCNLKYPLNEMIGDICYICKE